MMFIHKELDCFVASLLAMTKGWVGAAKKTKRPGKKPGLLKTCCRSKQSARCGELLLFDLALQLQCLRREVACACLGQERVEAAAVVDRLQRVGRNTQAHRAAERVRDQGDVAQVRQKPALGLVVLVADLVANLRALGRQFAAPRHGEILVSPRTAREGSRGGLKPSISGTAEL